jgi:hypothetical protein
MWCQFRKYPFCETALVRDVCDDSIERSGWVMGYLGVKVGIKTDASHLGLCQSSLISLYNGDLRFGVVTSAHSSGYRAWIHGMSSGQASKLKPEGQILIAMTVKLYQWNDLFTFTYIHFCLWRWGRSCDVVWQPRQFPTLLDIPSTCTTRLNATPKFSYLTIFKQPQNG